MTETHIAPLAQTDLPELQNVVSATGLFPAEMLPDMTAAALAGADPAPWLVAHIEGTAVGFAYTVPEDFADGTWNMLALAVAPRLQARGVGSALVAATENKLRKEGQRILIVDTSGTDAFARARAFYAQCGYDEEARIRDFWAEGDDKVTFRKAL